MPIIRYFAFLSGLLLALLFAADRYLPAPVERAGAADPDRTTIRISSARSLPEKIVFDTRPRTDVPEMVQAEPTAEVPHQAMREALAAMPAAAPHQIKKEPRARTSTEARPHAKRLAKSSSRPPEPRLAFERYDLFSGGWW
ncbi:hypothetical protein IVB14_29080 [Bradyrhizobium sp. 180]|uniref:hypothetical protein n=1 Tax=unclassified Bradyrhizobium TaxID=2631580 RepID=UPI001FF753A6|nr:MULTISPECIES: hypothetical protein [unclassified Bradyrhizobium]MCK1423573.1 hypothetical protein [Bradyrhizobium sp. CW12]MCK1494357.1 hypothetical protein [Bradyrhizobium sp. 180]MCK1531654.1 hypothetical protein [Bradyrhizobium sp. 182]MCK1594982.1 hypothetical protein [Bradyrhizobium sp. 164]MCK1647066.1 hypothetical protein [Bradyrhizobium sp. 154]